VTQVTALPTEPFTKPIHTKDDLVFLYCSTQTVSKQVWCLHHQFARRI